MTQGHISTAAPCSPTRCATARHPVGPSRSTSCASLVTKARTVGPAPEITAGTPREFQARIAGHLAAAITPTGGLFVLLIVAANDQAAAVALSIEPDHFG